MSKGTPIRPVRVADPLWGAAQARAQERGESVSEAVRWFLEEYVAGRVMPDSAPGRTSEG